MKQEAIDRAAETYLKSRTGARQIERIPDDIRPATTDEAYDVQDALHRRLAEAGWGRIAGHKIGCTSVVMQQFLNIDEPCAGMVFDSTVHRGTGRYDRSRFCFPGVECEIAVRLGVDLAGPVDYTPETVAPAVAAAMASIELVDERIANFRELGAPPLIADDFFNAGCVLGPETDAVAPERLKDLPGRMRINGETIGEGVGADIMGDPLAALAWLATLRARRGQPLKAGEFVTLGSIVQTARIEAGDVVEMEIDGLGEAALRME